MDDIKEFIEDTFGVKKIKEYDFRQICGFTFVFESDIICIKEKVSSASINPVGIIYEENGEFYFTPLHETVEIEEVIKAYVKTL